MLSDKLLKQAEYEDGGDVQDKPLADGYMTMQRYGAIPAAALGAYGVYKGKGFKGKSVYGLAGVGAGFVGTMAGKAGIDEYKKYKQAKLQEEQAKLQALMQQSS